MLLSVCPARGRDGLLNRAVQSLPIERHRQRKHRQQAAVVKQQWLRCVRNSGPGGDEAPRLKQEGVTSKNVARTGGQVYITGMQRDSGGISRDHQKSTYTTTTRRTLSRRKAAAAEEQATCSCEPPSSAWSSLPLRCGQHNSAHHQPSRSWPLSGGARRCESQPLVMAVPAIKVTTARHPAAPATGKGRNGREGAGTMGKVCRYSVINTCSWPWPRCLAIDEQLNP
ncbi:hypothetical protein B0J12DRAFT_381550 [Macrophomina phaseolina]|uniref:Uncharacterized protein n=1 Tax=Macrophomina phaseolina TaxID=35725 RepID=A0ABQ8GKU4_9PEZI|nr:hypothetical protein B0J12DRAFT_381550 [Macrophomina phaseolina]